MMSNVELITLMRSILADMRNCSDSSPNLAPPSSVHDVESTPNMTLGMKPELQIPKFDGSNPRLWIKKCCKYFTLCKIPDDQKVMLASLNMIDKAANWVSSYLSIRAVVDWNDFIIDVNDRFQDFNVVEDFNKLQQTIEKIDRVNHLDSVMSDYDDNSGNLQTVMLDNNVHLLGNFMGGVKSVVSPFVKDVMLPTSAASIEFAKPHKHFLHPLNEAFEPNIAHSSWTTPKPITQPTLLMSYTKAPLLPTPTIHPTKFPLARTLLVGFSKSVGRSLVAYFNIGCLEKSYWLLLSSLGW
uniref:Uncharacterized protein n=1 Tax=Chenopodium quinoa TaxID=63459 RepID=A0A803KVR8_CHEQI